MELYNPHLDQVLILLCVSLQAEPSQQVLLSSLDYLVENVEIPFSMVLVDHPRLLQQVVNDVAADGSTLSTG